jgi:hypothetical protein
MRSLHTARLTVAAALLFAGASALSPSATAAQEPPPMVQPFEPPAAPGETAPPTGTAAVESSEPVEAAPGVTGVETQMAPQGME